MRHKESIEKSEVSAVSSLGSQGVDVEDTAKVARKLIFQLSLKISGRSINGKNARFLLLTAAV